MSDAQVVVNVSKDIIDAHVKAAIAAALSKDPGELVRAVVDMAMRKPSERNYGRTTVWEDRVTDMIHEVAKGVFDQWLEELKPTIAKEVRQRLAGKNGRATIDGIVEQLTSSLERFQVSVYLKDVR